MASVSSISMTTASKIINKDEKSLQNKKRTQARNAEKAMLMQTSFENLTINNRPALEWCNFIWTSPDPLWTFKASTTISPLQALQTVAAHFNVSKKIKDLDKVFPRQQRLDLLVQEKENPGSTISPFGAQATWKFDVKNRWISTLGDTQLIGSAENPTPFLTVSPNILYEKPTEGTLQDIEEYHRDPRYNPIQPGETRPLPPASALETFYIDFVQAHVEDHGKHLGRDKTAFAINKYVSSTFVKDLIHSLIGCCQVCIDRDNAEARAKSVANSQITREKKKANKRPAEAEPEASSSTSKRTKTAKNTSKKVPKPKNIKHEDDFVFVPILEAGEPASNVFLHASQRLTPSQSTNTTSSSSTSVPFDQEKGSFFEPTNPEQEAADARYEEWFFSELSQSSPSTSNHSFPIDPMLLGNNITSNQSQPKKQQSDQNLHTPPHTPTNPPTYPPTYPPQDQFMDTDLDLSFDYDAFFDDLNLSSDIEQTNIDMSISNNQP